jgi:hypothetical protein
MTNAIRRPRHDQPNTPMEGSAGSPAATGDWRRCDAVYNLISRAVYRPSATRSRAQQEDADAQSLAVYGTYRTRTTIVRHMAFAAASPLHDLLSRESAGPDDRRFSARNFLLDERVAESREERYLEYMSDLQPIDRTEWIAAHQDYLEDHVFVSPTETRPSPPVIVGPSETLCAETFHGDGYLGVELASSDYLIRLEALASLQSAFSTTPDDLPFFERLVDEVRAGNGVPPDVRTRADSVLRRWRRDLRPSFAAPATDVQDALDTGGEGWADALRNAMGLHHYDPDQWGGAINVVLFRYRVSELPQVASGGRALVAPCVLDGRLCDAFCPSPTSLGVLGHAVSLDERSRPVREIVHAPMQLLAAHIARVGTIGTPPKKSLASSRAAHFEWLRQQSGCESFGNMTDGDLVST